MTSEIKCIVLVNGESKANVLEGQTGFFGFRVLTNYECVILQNGKMCFEKSMASKLESFIVNQDPSDPTGCEITLLP